MIKEEVNTVPHSDKLLRSRHLYREAVTPHNTKQKKGFYGSYAPKQVPSKVIFFFFFKYKEGHKINRERADVLHQKKEKKKHKHNTIIRLLMHTNKEADDILNVEKKGGERKKKKRFAIQKYSKKNNSSKRLH